MRTGGRSDGETTVVEVDETCFYKWKHVNPDTGQKTFYWYAWFGACERGNLQSLWLEPIGVTKSEDPARFPPLAQEKWKEFASQIYKDGSNVVQMTDSAKCYKDYCPPGVVQRHYVNHQEHEYSRSVDLLGNVISKEEIPCMAGLYV